MSTIFFLLFWIIVLAVVAAVVLAKSYNSLQSLANRVKEAGSNIKVMLKKRLELANRLIDIASGYGSHEKLVHLKVSQDMAAGISSLAQSYRESSQALTYVSQLADKFPELKADRTYLQLMDDLKVIEGELQSKRETYNAFVRDYNIKRTSIPAVFYSRAMGFNTAPFLDFDAAIELDSIKDFRTDDGSMLQSVLSNFGSRIVETSKSLKNQTIKTGINLFEKGKQFSHKAKFYYVDSSNQPIGPKTLDELEELLVKGVVNDETYVIEEGGKEWKRLQSVRKKPTVLPPPPPPPPSLSYVTSRVKV